MSHDNPRTLQNDSDWTMSAPAAATNNYCMTTNSSIIIS